MSTPAIDLVRMPGFGPTPALDLAAEVRRLPGRVLAVALRALGSAGAAVRGGRVAGLVRILPGARLVAVAPLRVEARSGSLHSVPTIPQQRGPSRPRRVVTRHDMVLPADPTAPRRARAVLTELAAAWAVDETVAQDAAMVVTELVANAVDHARTASTLTVRREACGLRVAVRDSRPGPAPTPRPHDPTAARGRGLQMVDTLAAEWGVVSHADGKTVWAVLGRV